MVKRLVVLFILLSSLAFGALTNLVKEIVPETAFDSAPSRWSSPPDDGRLAVNIGFNFPLGGSSYSQLYIQTNGAISFENATIPYGNRTQFYKNSYLYPYWDDINPRNGGSIRYGLLDAGLNSERFVVSWLGTPHYPNSGSYTFQIVLYPNGSIRFRYDSSSSTNGASATVGIDITSSNYDAHSYNNSATFDASKDILYSMASAQLSLVKSSCVLADLINGTSNPKRIPGATIRFAVEFKNEGGLAGDNIIVTDALATEFDATTIENLQIQDGACDCLGVASTSNNGANGTSNGVNPVKLDFATVAGGSSSTPTYKCGYFEVKLK